LNICFNTSKQISENPNSRKPIENGEQAIPAVDWKNDTDKPKVDEAQTKKVDQSTEEIVKFNEPKITDNDVTAVETPNMDDFKNAIAGNVNVTANPDGIIGSENPGNENIEGSADGVENGTDNGTGNEVF